MSQSEQSPSDKGTRLSAEQIRRIKADGIGGALMFAYWHDLCDMALASLSAASSNEPDAWLKEHGDERGRRRADIYPELDAWQDSEGGWTVVPLYRSAPSSASSNDSGSDGPFVVRDVAGNITGFEPAKKEGGNGNV